jgi:hypothetical protein
MSTQSVYVDRMLCLSSSDNEDDIYVLMFRGRTVPPFNTGLALKGPENFWTDFDDGELWNQDILMVQYFPDAVYGAILVDQDDGTDISKSRLKNIGLKCAQAWKTELLSQQAAGNAPGSAAAKNAAFAAVKAILGPQVEGAGNDDVITPDNTNGVQRITVGPGNPTPPFTFKGQGGWYEVIFKVASP